MKIEVSGTSSLRLDLWLTERLPEESRSSIRQRILKKEILVNGVSCKASYRPVTGDIITVEEKQPFILKPKNIPLHILYEDEELVCIDKPKGMVVHPGAGEEEDTLAAALLAKYGAEGLSDCNGPERPGIVHRLDKDTSGVLLVCKNNDIHQIMAAKIQSHDFLRRYRGIVVGTVQEEGFVEQPIARHPKIRTKMAVVPGGRYAKTLYRPLKALDRMTYMEFELLTGRTHQIRVHMSWIHRPILGDPLYGKPSRLTQGQALHAYELGFEHPRTGEYLLIRSELPEYMKKLVGEFDNEGNI